MGIIHRLKRIHKYKEVTYLYFNHNNYVRTKHKSFCFTYRVTLEIFKAKRKIMRTKEELGQLILDNIHRLSKDSISSPKGLCDLLGRMYCNRVISEAELHSISSVIKNNPPKGVEYSPTNYYWPEGEIQPRVDWIHRHLLEEVDSMPINDIRNKLAR